MYFYEMLKIFIYNNDVIFYSFENISKYKISINKVLYLEKYEKCIKNIQNN